MTPATDVNQLVLATVAGTQVRELRKRLLRDGFHVTEVDSSAGLLQETTVSMLIGLDKARLPLLLEHIRKCCRTRRKYLPAHVEVPFLEAQPVMIEAEVGGATIYVLNVQRFEQL